MFPWPSSLSLLGASGPMCLRQLYLVYIQQLHNTSGYSCHIVVILVATNLVADRFRNGRPERDSSVPTQDFPKESRMNPSLPMDSSISFVTLLKVRPTCGDGRIFKIPNLRILEVGKFPTLRVAQAKTWLWIAPRKAAYVLWSLFRKPVVLDWVTEPGYPLESPFSLKSGEGTAR
jgi:hypothetical protein